MGNSGTLVLHNRYQTILAVCRSESEKDYFAMVIADLAGIIRAARPLRNGERLHFCFGPVLDDDSLLDHRHKPVFHVPVVGEKYRPCAARLAVWIEINNRTALDIKYTLYVDDEGVAVADGPKLSRDELNNLIGEIMVGNYNNVDAYFAPPMDIVGRFVRPVLDGMATEDLV